MLNETPSELTLYLASPSQITGTHLQLVHLLYYDFSPLSSMFSIESKKRAATHDLFFFYARRRTKLLALIIRGDRLLSLSDDESAEAKVRTQRTVRYSSASLLEYQ